MRSSPFSIQSTLLQMRRSTVVECETMSTAVPQMISSRMRFSLFSRKKRSPTLSTSSRMSTPDTWPADAMAKARRDTMPEE